MNPVGQITGITFGRSDNTDLRSGITVTTTVRYPLACAMDHT